MDGETKAMILLWEIGEIMKDKDAEYVRESISKPVVAHSGKAYA